ncbi:MAG TPA: SagB/ThcOx family dehydrogenase [Usitatibacter sp.]|nr:SagB/ThcOx family dehydrogenase [Usitatibacter sp.]
MADWPSGGVVALPPARLDPGASLGQALERRRSMREFSPRELDLAALSALLWSACGVNRPESAHRTAPSARNWQEIDVYVVTAAGVALYDPARNELRPVAQGDHRAATGLQDFVAHAPVNLVYVADFARMPDAPTDARALYSAIDTGTIAQNVYLHCAAAGLGCVIRGLVDRDALAPVLHLRPAQRVIAAQSVGYPT